MSIIRTFQYSYFTNTAKLNYNDYLLPKCNPAMVAAAREVSKLAGNSRFVLEGDSIATGAGLLAKKKDFLDLAVPSSTTVDLAYRFQMTALKCMPERIVLNIGGNDIDRISTDDSILMIMACVKQARSILPKTIFNKIAWVKVTPVLSSKADLQKKIIAFNNRVAGVLALNGVEILDPWPVIAGPDGFARRELIGSDDLHWNLQAYMIMVPFLNRWYAA